MHEFISTCGLTLPGKPHTSKLEDDEDAHGQIVYEHERKCPRILNDASMAQPAIDCHNRYRQAILAMEKRILTNRFCVRGGTSLYGMLFTNCFFAVQTWGDPQAVFKNEMRKLSLYMMHNPIRRAELELIRGPAKSPSSSASASRECPLLRSRSRASTAAASSSHSPA